MGFALRGSTDKNVIDAALSSGVVKVDMGAEAQWNVYDPRKWELTMVSLLKEACVDVKNTDGKPTNGVTNGLSIAARGARNPTQAEIMAELKETATKLCAP